MNHDLEYLIEKRYPLKVDYSDPEKLLTAYRYLLDLIENDIEQIKKDKTFFLDSNATYEKMLAGEIPVYINMIHAWILGREFRDGVKNEITEKIAGDSHCFEIARDDKDFDRVQTLIREEIEDSSRKYVNGHIRLRGIKEKRTALLEEIKKLEKVLSISGSEPLTPQQQRQAGNTDGLRAVDEMLNRYFNWQRLRPILIETGTITPDGDHYRFTRSIPRKYLATALYSVARAEVRRNTNGAKRSAQQTIREVFLDLDGTNFNRSFWETDFRDPPDLDKIKNDTAREIIEKLQSVQH